MKKIFWLIVLLVTFYLVSIFLAPSFADKIGDLLGIKTLNEQIRGGAGDVNEFSTNIPDTEKIKKGYEETVKKAGKYKENIVDGIDKTKVTIDDIRLTLSGAEDTYDKAKEVFDDTINTVDNVKNSIGDLDKLSDGIKGSVNTDRVK